MVLLIDEDVQGKPAAQVHSVSLLHLSELDFWNDMCRKVFGMQQTVYQNLPDPTTIASKLSVHDSLPRLIL